jgi:formylglycine-generating enzyme required for sulfatase activity
MTAGRTFLDADGKWLTSLGVPSPAVSPFDGKEAREYQQAWAAYLGIPMEITNSIGMQMVLIPPGEFEMGSKQDAIDEEAKRPNIEQQYLERLPMEGPRHRVRLSRAFYLGKYEVTQQEYQSVMGKNPSEFSEAGKSKDQVLGQDTHRLPVERVAWPDAAEFCHRLSALEDERIAKRRYRLPSEAQWEYSCRAGSQGPWCFSTDSGGRADGETPGASTALSDYAWFLANSGARTHTVGMKLPNAWGLHDMHGTVWERCEDCLSDDYYANSPANDPGGPPSGTHRCYRGGGWGHPAWRCRSAHRDGNSAETRDNCIGFRVLLVLEDELTVSAEREQGRNPVPAITAASGQTR